MPTLKPYAVVVLALASSLIAACCCLKDFTSSRPGAHLLGEFLSYSSFEKIRRSSLSGHDFEVVQRTSCHQEDRRPCFQIIVRKTNFTHLGVVGEIWLTFFNDRLYGTMFYPKEIDRYLDKLAASGLRLPRGSEPLDLSPNTLVWSGNDDEARPYVAWIDRRLLDEGARWTKCYGAIGNGGNLVPRPLTPEVP